MLTELSVAPNKVVGAKQARRALGDGRASKVFLATDADPRITEVLAAQCAELGVPLIEVDSMKALGEACGISVGAAVAVIV